MSIPAHITEYGRIMLWDIVETVGIENVIYCDTDSIIIPKSKVGKIVNMVNASELGMLKTEYETEKLRIHGCKDYQTDQFTKIKGVPKSADQITENTFRYNQFLGQSSHLRLEEWNHFIIRETVKTNKRIYDKGNVSASGKVTPFVLGET
ncbi:unnamed protein product [marine sediment metagenome]|uniref:Uncharacterized protein n=1 Tax=marine sediment metagenome TaxID=412755 RepID=X1EQA3_9ZZZZ